MYLYNDLYSSYDRKSSPLQTINLSTRAHLSSIPTLFNLTSAVMDRYSSIPDNINVFPHLPLSFICFDLIYKDMSTEQLNTRKPDKV